MMPLVSNIHIRCLKYKIENAGRCCQRLLLYWSSVDIYEAISIFGRKKDMSAVPDSTT